MSDITAHTKACAEGFIRYERPASLLHLGITTLSSFAFMKAAVLDADANLGCFHVDWTRQFAVTTEIPEGVQIWLAHCRSRAKFSAKVLIHTLTVYDGSFRGYEFFILTYQVGYLVFQVTYPRWTKRFRARPPRPKLTQDPAWDAAAIPLWPGVQRVTWPPEKHLTDETLRDVFHPRFGKLRERIR